MKKFNCNILDGDYLEITHVNQDINKDEDDNFLDVQIYDDRKKTSLGVTLSLQSTKELINELQSYIDENEKF